MNDMTAGGVPNPMAGLPPSPNGSHREHGTSLSSPPLSPLSAPSPLEFASPEGFVQFADGESEAKRARADVGSSSGIRWSCDAQRSLGGRPSSLSPGETSFEPVNFSPHPHPYHQPTHGLAASKASSGSLASSHPSHNSFASTQTDSSVPVSTPDSALYAAPSAGHHAASSQGAACTAQRWHSAQPQAQAVSSHAQSQTTDKRLKRLERNRESARLSRKRRKAYLEELEAKVHSLSAQMDRERILYANGFLRQVRDRIKSAIYGENHAAEKAITVVRNPLAQHQQQQQQQNALGQGIKHNVQSLPPPSLHAGFNNANGNNNNNTVNNNNVIHNLHNVTRLPSALQIIYTFQHQYQSSLVVSKESKFILWLMLQKEGFWRGGRGSSERLSAARIGERLLHNGTYRASPCEGMWPLFCHEVGLSYEQEDKVRTTQRAILADSSTWINRYTAAATKSVIDSINTTISGMHESAKHREVNTLGILTSEQRIKFLSWAARKSSAIRQLARAKANLSAQPEEYQVSPQRHVAANMYIVDHRLSKVKTRLVAVPRLLHPSRLKKLSRRPSFESLAGQEAWENNAKLNREASFPSTGSLKRSLNELVGDESHSMAAMSSTHSGVTPESAQAAAQSAVKAVLHDIMPIVPQRHLRHIHHAHFRPCTPAISSQSCQPSYHAPSPMAAAPEALYPESRLTSTMPLPPQSALPVEPPSSTDDIDIPMPTPVSVLLQTQDEFISPYNVDASHAPVEVIPSLQQQQPPPIDNGYIPAPVLSDFESVPPTSQVRPSARAYQSAPQLYTGDDFDYPSIMQSTMIPVPEEGLIQNPILNEDGLCLDDLPLADPNDWAIGESFDIDIDNKNNSN
ncbi:hypothetical protein HJC23_001792 [Cyclotella cryptica]|uniref:BZIP domain-containing protein n=1 Tax=Cyclotella cryptica TaxID=29204 RepID=A0ABD3QPC8_9STRA|eukprot:CCRYP_003363-RA/>CCRYP_003363-RA protein AED:0.05 eAED:0.05 QI:346/1/1/1/0.5/0.33/3/2312/855